MIKNINSTVEQVLGCVKIARSNFFHEKIDNIKIDNITRSLSGFVKYFRIEFEFWESVKVKK